MKNQLTYSQKMETIIEASKNQHIEFKVRLIKYKNENSDMNGIVKLNAIDQNEDILDAALKLEDMINEFECLEILYDDDKVLWHIDDDKCDPEISDKNFKQFLKFIGWDKVR